MPEVIGGNILILEEALLLLFLTFLRTAFVVGMMPGALEGLISKKLLLLLAIGISISISETTNLPNSSEINASQVIRLSTVEMYTGAALGLFIRTSTYVLVFLASIVSQVSSLLLVFADAAASQSIIERVFTLSGICFLMLTGLIVDLLFYIIHSYEFLPIQDSFNMIVAHLTSQAIALVNDAFKTSFLLSGVFVLIFSMYSITLAVMNRIFPQLMIVLIGAPISVLTLLVALAVYVTGVLSIWANYRFVSFDVFMSVN